MDSIHNLLMSPWLAAAGTLASLVGLLLTAVSMLNYLQRRSQKLEYRTGEDSYLQGLIEYVHHVNVHTSFDEHFFIEREYKLKDKYQARSFFMAKHQAVPQFRRVFNGVIGQSSKTTEGYFTKNLFREATGKNEPIIVLGEPGSGKSVTARHLATSIAAKTLNSRRPNRLIPVFLSLSEYINTNPDGSPVDFYDFLVSTLKRRGVGTSFRSQYLLDHLDYYLDAGRLFFILDSLDEMPPSTFTNRCRAIENFIIQHSTSCFVITCRSNDFGANINGREAYLDKLTPKEIDAFIRKRRTLLGHWKTDEIYDRIVAPDFVLNSVIDNPFYLNLILFFVSIQGMLPENFPLLFRVVCADWADREIRKQVVKENAYELRNLADETQLGRAADDLRSALAHIAFVISSSSGFGTAINLSEIKQAATRYGMAVKTIERAIQLGISGGMLDVSLDYSQVRFVHHKFQEYFAAEFLEIALDHNWVKYQDLPAICRNIWWEEVTALLTSITEHPDEIIETLLNDANTSDSNDSRVTTLKRNFWLVGRAIRSLPDEAPSKPELVSRVIDNMIRKIEDSRLPELLDCLKGLGEIDDLRSVEILSGYLKRPSKILRELAFSALANFSLGRRFLAEHVHQIGYAIYVKGKYGGYGGRHAKQVRNIAFPSGHPRAIMAFYAAIGGLIRFHLVILTLGFLVFAGNWYLTNAYGVIFIGARLGLDATFLFIFRGVPRLRFVLMRLGARAVWLVVIALIIAWGFFTPPFWSALSLGVLSTMPVTLVILSLFVPKVGKYGLRNALVNMLNPQSWAEASEHADILGLKLGHVDADAYVQSRIFSTRDLKTLLNKIEDSEFGGLELEIYEALQNAERRLYQKEISPKILTDAEYPDQNVERDDT